LNLVTLKIYVILLPHFMLKAPSTSFHLLSKYNLNSILPSHLFCLSTSLHLLYVQPPFSLNKCIYLSFFIYPINTNLPSKFFYTIKIYSTFLKLNSFQPLFSPTNTLASFYLLESTIASCSFHIRCHISSMRHVLFYLQYSLIRLLTNDYK